jgi:hypothetical protein
MCLQAATRASAYLLTYFKAERGFWLKLTKILPNLQILKYSNWIPSVHILVIIFKPVQGKKNSVAQIAVVSVMSSRHFVCL